MAKYEAAIKHILSAMKEGLPSELTYHSLEHTLAVISLTEEIAEKEGINHDDFNLLKVSAAFHDCGYLKGLKEHEINGCKMVDDILPEFGFTPHESQRIKGMIMATRLPQTPMNHLEQIICDADLAYIGGDNYFEIVEGLKAEIVATSHPLSEKEWLDMQISFLKAHSFFTEYAIKTFENKKLEVLQKLMKDQYT
jgi:HD superfamily phosphodiesterase